jgi:hypothetical protein
VFRALRGLVMAAKCYRPVSLKNIQAFRDELLEKNAVPEEFLHSQSSTSISVPQRPSSACL